MSAVYRWKRGQWGRIDVNDAVAELDKLAADDVLTPEKIVEAARPKHAVLHDAFEWSDEVAGEEWRKHQAGQLVRSIVRVVARGEQDEPLHTRAFVSVNISDQPQYVSAAVAISDDKLRAQLLASAFRELEAFRKKYEDLEELVPIFEAVDAARGLHQFVSPQAMTPGQPEASL